MTAADVPTTSGMPNNGYEGMRFLGYPVFEPLVGWDLSRTDVLAGLKPALAESWEQDAADPRKWRFRLRQGVQFHDGTPLTADAVVWNFDRFFRNDSPQFDPAGSAITRGRIAVLAGYRKLDDRTVEMETTRPVSYWPYLVTSGADHLAAILRAGGARLGARRRPAARGHRAVPPDALRAAPAGGAVAQRRVLERRGPRQARPRGAAADAGGEHPPRRAAQQPGGLDRGAAARRGAVAPRRRLPDHHGQLPACLALGLRRRRSRAAPWPTRRCARRSNYCIDRDGHGGAAERHGGALGRLLQGERSELRRAAEPLPPRPGARPRAAGRGGLHARSGRCASRSASPPPAPARCCRCR